MTSARDFARGVNPHHPATTITFHNDNFGPWKAGEVIRVFDGPFGDAVILGFSDRGDAKCSRPYAYASCVGTTGPGVLLGAETIIYSAAALRAYDVVGRDRVTT